MTNVKQFKREKRENQRPDLYEEEKTMNEIQT